VHRRTAGAVSRLWPAALLLLAVAGCANTNLGDIDESVDSREQMPGPGIFADESGESRLKWSSDGGESPAPAVPADSASAAEKAEFEQFKIWNELRTTGRDSAEYREFQQWLEYRKFKAAE
jgi:hypothetical protein